MTPLPVFPRQFDTPGIPVLVITGPTGCGKSALTEALFAGKNTFRPAAIVSADSMQVYRGMDIGTAKPSPAVRAILPHYLVDIREPYEQFNAGDFVRLAGEACKTIAAQGRLPVVCGGTFFYLTNFTGGLSEAPPSAPKIRSQLKTELAERGAEALWEELRECDSISAAHIHKNDEYRVLRALEVFRICGKPLSGFRAAGALKQAAGLFGHTGVDAAATEFRFIVVAVVRERGSLYQRINERVRTMMRQGLADEVAALSAQGYTPEQPGLKAIGYREFFVKDENGVYRFLGGGTVAPDFYAEIEALIAQNTRRYAKRQLTWLRSLPQTPTVVLDEDAGAYHSAANNNYGVRLAQAACDTIKRLLESHGL